MRVLLVTFTDLLPLAFMKVLNPALDYCAIVVDEPDIAKKMLANVPQLRDRIFPFYELKECIKDSYYDSVLCISDGRNAWDVHEKFIQHKLPNNKYINICLDNNGTCNGFLKEKTLQYYRKHATEFEMFATGICYIGMGLDIQQFKLKLFNFGRSGNDLYYDYQTAKFVFTHTGGGKFPS